MGRVLAHGLGDVEWPGAVRLLCSLPFLQDWLERPSGRPGYLTENNTGHFCREPLPGFYIKLNYSKDFAVDVFSSAQVYPETTHYNAYLSFQLI